MSSSPWTWTRPTLVGAAADFRRPAASYPFAVVHELRDGAVTPPARRADCVSGNLQKLSPIIWTANAELGRFVRRLPANLSFSQDVI